MRTVEERQAARNGDDGAAIEDAEALKPLGEEAPEVVQMGARIGQKRLDRPLVGDAMTSFIGGMSVSFGAVAMAWAGATAGGSGSGTKIGALVGALAFPVGFLILLIGKSELFTENFFLPVTAVLERRGKPKQLASLWAVSLAFNLLGALVFAALVSRPDVLDAAPAHELVELAEQKCAYAFSTAFTKAIFAGWLMTLLTWMLIAARGLGPRLVVIWSIATLIVLGRFNHVVISASEVFIAIMLGARVTPAVWFTKNFLPALAGNVLGGTVFVTLLFYIQAQYHHADDKPAREAHRDGAHPDLRTRRRDWSA
ncbi:MAG TPA: formate/nitrite transporter family protein [Minicystis sp.]|nr:formate/nitrite transporter family protein [Minicystis sp.]